MFALQIYEQKEYKQLDIRKKVYISQKGIPESRNAFLAYMYFLFFLCRPSFFRSSGGLLTL